MELLYLTKYRWWINWSIHEKGVPKCADAYGDWDRYFLYLYFIFI